MLLWILCGLAWACNVAVQVPSRSQTKNLRKHVDFVHTFCGEDGGTALVLQATEITPDVENFLLHALLLRLQSATNVRHSDLKIIEWSHVEKLEHVQGLDECVFTIKISSLKVLAANSTPVEYLACDAITSALMSYWYQYYGKKGKWLFPKVNRHGQFNFDLQLTYDTHAEAAKLCAEVLQLPVSSEFKKHLGCKAVKRGNAAQLGVAIRGAWQLCFGLGFEGNTTNAFFIFGFDFFGKLHNA